MHYLTWGISSLLCSIDLILFTFPSPRTERQSAQMSKITNGIRLNPVWHRMLYPYSNSGHQRVNAPPPEGWPHKREWQLTRRRATRRWDSIQARRSETRSHVAVADVLHADPTVERCCLGHPSTAWYHLERCQCSWHRLCVPETVCTNTTRQSITFISRPLAIQSLWRPKPPNGQNVVSRKKVLHCPPLGWVDRHRSSPTFFAQRARGCSWWHAFHDFNMSIHSRDITVVESCRESRQIRDVFHCPKFCWGWQWYRDR